MSIVEAVLKYCERERDEARKAAETERNQMCIAPNSYIAKEIKYQTALLHDIKRNQETLLFKIEQSTGKRQTKDNGKKNSPLSKLVGIIRQKG